MNRLRGIVVLAGFATLTLPLMPVQQILRWTWPKLGRVFPHYYHRMLARLLGFYIRVEGDIPQQAALLVANHVSWIDIVAFSAVLPVSFVAKHEVGRWPLFGQLARLQGSVFVEREKRHRTGHARDAITDRLLGGDTVMLFPEGTSHDGSRVRRFHTSFFAVAEAGHIPVVPVSIAYTEVNGLPMTRRRRPFFAWYGDMDLPPHVWQAVQWGPIGITIRFHPSLPAAPRKDMARQAQAVIDEGLALVLHGRDKMG
jgi:lyso-ornithine lipid O-acyltransferase